MAPPSRLRPHLNDLLQKNLELEHVVADLRHQLTQSSAKWADERKTLAVGCDVLMASFAKFRARLDVHPSPDWGDSEGEVEQNLDAGRQSEETGEVDNGMPETERDRGSLATEDLHERCRALAAELRVKEEELEEYRRKREEAEVQFGTLVSTDELQRIQGSLDAQSDQLRAALASAKPDTSNILSPERTTDDPSAQANKTGLENTLEKLDLANQEITRLKQLLQEWKKYGSEWKRDGQIARSRVSELQRKEDELSAKVNAAEESKALLDTEIQRLTSTLADQTTALEHQHVACQESVKRVHELEAMVELLRVQLSPEQLASSDSGQNQQNQQNHATSGPSSLSQSPTPQADTNANKRSDLIVLKIPYRGANKFIRKPLTANNEPQNEQHNVVVSSSHQVASASTSIRATFSTASRSFDEEASSEPRRAKCRPPTEAELALAAEEAMKFPPPERTSVKRTGVEGAVGGEGSGEPEEPEEPEGGSAREEEAQEREEERSPRMVALSEVLGKRLRPHTSDGEESQRARKLRPRISITAKP
ncbi:hypothetical protein OG21DRAFT_1579471 [Imleria badia]|nr:hypothetical protein OG21DRAFT_1579471 [Imleria badia]